MDTQEKHPALPKDVEEQELKPLKDSEVEAVSGGKRPPPSVYHDKPFF